MTEHNEPLPGSSEGTAQLPPIGEYVWVQCQGYRTMAYRDKEGLWRRLSNDKEVTGIIKVEWPEHG
jgi:hypothetical protein